MTRSRFKARRYLAALLLVLIGAACSTAPYTGRKQLMLVSAEQLSSMGDQAFAQMLHQQATSDNKAAVDYVKCVANPIVENVVKTHENAPKHWRLAVFEDATPNAFVLPGGNIGVNTGLLKVAQTDEQLAAVIGHEIGHQLANHAGERTSQAVVAQGGLAVTEGLLLADMSSGSRNAIMAALGLGAQVGVLLPFSRKQESEADAIGIQLMAQAGYNPEQSVDLWENMAKASQGSAPPEFLSTHPDPQNRIAHLNEMMPTALTAYKSAVQGRTPAAANCQRPTMP